MYQDRYHNRLISCAKSFRQLHATVGETGTFNKNAGEGRPENVTTPKLKEAIFDVIEDPSRSTRKIALQLKVSPKTKWKIIKMLQMFHIMLL